MNKFFSTAIGMLALVAVLAACGDDREARQRLGWAERIRLIREDSAALKIAVMPTLDCLPVWVAKEAGIFDSLGLDARMRVVKSQMDVDQLLRKGKVEGAVTDLVRGQRLKRQGTELDYVAATDARWTLVANRNARIKTLKQLDDTMVAMTRFSATAWLTDKVNDSVKLKAERVYQVQINDVDLRLAMLLGNEMDAAWLPEPHATVALAYRNVRLTDSRQAGLHPGVIGFRAELKGDSTRERQISLFLKAYDMACDSITRRGTAHFAALMERKWKLRKGMAGKVSKDYRFPKAAPPKQEEIEKADKWLDKH